MVLKAADLGGFLQAPITHATALAGDGQSCAFLTTGFLGHHGERAPGARQGLARRLVGRKNAAAGPTRSTDVGDAAVWQDTLHEVIAQKNDLLCDIQLRGGNDDIAVRRGCPAPRSWARCATEFSRPLR